MPEIGEVARIVHYLKKHLVGRTIAAAKTQEDEIVYGKAGTSASAFQAAMAGKKVVDAKQQGKYFWLEMNKPPHPLMHFGMTGWMKFSNEDTAYYKPTKKDEDEWPPRFWKFVLECEGEPECKVAFIDARRLGRIRLVEAEGNMMRKTSPLKENGPDPVVDKDILTVDWLAKKMRSKKVPIKALLLDQANISGVGNWVGDEVLFQARIHPEQYSNTFSDKQIETLHEKLIEVCTFACETLADSDKFPDNWIMRHRWKKGKKESSTLPTGEKIVHITVGGRTSAVVPSLQKKTGAVAGDASSEQLNDEVENEDDGDGGTNSRKRGRDRKAIGAVKQGADTSGSTKSTKQGRGTLKTLKDVESEDSGSETPAAGSKKRKRSSVKSQDDTEARKLSTKTSKSQKPVPQDRRRSTRIRSSG